VRTCTLTLSREAQKPDLIESGSKISQDKCCEVYGFYFLTARIIISGQPHDDLLKKLTVG